MIAFEYTSESFSEVRFRENGALVAVVLNYNKAGLIRAAVRSALEQDWPCYEVLAMDDKSTDGSDAEMLEAVKSWTAANPKKALRVRVVVNETNLTTLGQWREAVRFSDGAWFGMFCGDDIALPERMRVAAELIAAHPQAAGICTNYYRGKTQELVHPISVSREAIFGCSAFWARRVLEADLPRGTLDDWTLSWIARIIKAGELVFAMDRATVRYSFGTGVTTELTEGVPTLVGKYLAILARGRRFGRNVWDLIRDFDANYGTDARLSREIRGWWVLSATEGGGWWKRIGALWTIFVVDWGNDYGGKRREIVTKAVGRFVTRFLGRWSFALTWKLRGMFA